MVEFKTRIFNEDNGQIIGAEVLVYSDNGDKIGTIDIADATTLNELKQQLDLIDETYFTEERLGEILNNSSENTVINATRLNGFISSDFAKVNQLSNYSLSSHTHTKNQVTNLYDYYVSSSDYNPKIDDKINITVTVRDSRGNLVPGHPINLLKNNESWKTGSTGSNGQFTAMFDCSEWGLIDFSVGTSHCSINVNGWREVTLPSAFGSSQLFYNDTDVEFHIRCTLSNIQNTGVFLMAFSELVPLDYRPSLYVVGSADRDTTVFFRVNTAGTVHYKALTTASGSYEYRAILRWKRN